MHRQPPSRTPAIGFTLVELLVVIAIISLLVSIILPSLSQSREVARKVKCKANMRQMAVANAAYATDFKGYAPLVNSSENSYAGWTWMFSLAPYLNGPDKSQMVAIGASPTSGANWVKSPAVMMPVLQCPSTWRTFDIFGYNSYAINVNLTNEPSGVTSIDWPCRPTARQTEMRHDNLCLFSESVGYNQIVPVWNAAILYDKLHLRVRNVTMFDGHVVEATAQTGSYLMGYYKPGSPNFGASFFGRNNHTGTSGVNNND